MSKAIEVNDASFENEVRKSDRPTLVDFWAEWCMPCKTLGPVIDEVAEQLSDRIKVCKVNVDDNAQTATDMSVMNIPTVIFFKGGQEAGRFSGAMPKENIVQKVNEWMNA